MRPFNVLAASGLEKKQLWNFLIGESDRPRKNAATKDVKGVSRYLMIRRDTTWYTIEN